MGRATLTPGEQLHDAMRRFLGNLQVDKEVMPHLVDTPHRFVKALHEYFAGLKQDPVKVLTAGFPSHGYDEMVFVNNISFVSFCAHHLVPFLGKVHFAYIPENKIVGLSKIPRMIEVYAKRPQVQEKMTQEIVDTFYTVIQPKGCACMVEAYHTCMAIRGIKKDTAYTRTTALRGCFKSDPATKSEFLDGVNKGRGNSIWP